MPRLQEYWQIQENRYAFVAAGATAMVVLFGTGWGWVVSFACIGLAAATAYGLTKLAQYIDAKIAKIEAVVDETNQAVKRANKTLKETKKAAKKVNKTLDRVNDEVIEDVVQSVKGVRQGVDDVNNNTLPKIHDMVKQAQDEIIPTITKLSKDVSQIGEQVNKTTLPQLNATLGTVSAPSRALNRIGGWVGLSSQPPQSTEDTPSDSEDVDLSSDEEENNGDIIYAERQPPNFLPQKNLEDTRANDAEQQLSEDAPQEEEQPGIFSSFINALGGY